MARRPHTKSRRGCAECKRRHIKCDEGRPGCANCSISKRRCHYAVSSEIPDAVTGSRSNEPARQPTTVSSPAPLPLADHRDSVPINMGHLSLLSHLFLRTLPDTNPTGQNYILTQHLMDCATITPYLMHELLAIGALHCSHLHRQAAIGEDTSQRNRSNGVGGSSIPCHGPTASTSHREQAEAFRRQAVDLRAQAVELFNKAENSIDPLNCLPLFLFTSSLGLHSLADAAISVAEDDGDNFLDRFIEYLDVHRGVKLVVNASYQHLKASVLSPVLENAEQALPSTGDTWRRHQCDRLQTLLDSTSDLRSESLDACREAVEVLKNVFESQQAWYDESPVLDADHSSTGLGRSESGEDSSPAWTGLSADSSVAVPPDLNNGPTFAWPVLISAEFTRLLRKRCPEALIILAYFAVVLHRQRHTWIVGGSGQVLIKQITSQLGSFWWEWLEWPNQTLSV